MKKYLVLFLIFALMLSGCGNVSVEDAEAKNDSQENYILASDTEIITEVDLSQLNDTEIEYALQEIYARHGKVFNDTNYKKYFSSQDWYSPDPGFEMDSLTELELENADYIQAYINEKNEAKNADSELAAYEELSEKQLVKIAQKNLGVPDKNGITYELGEKFYNEVWDAHYRPISFYENGEFVAGANVDIETGGLLSNILGYDDMDDDENYSGDNSYIVPDSDTRRLTQSELEGFSSDTLALIRNEIYARHGYVFQKQKYRDYFGSKLWYYPDPDFDGSGLNSIEKYNVELIKSME